MAGLSGGDAYYQQPQPPPAEGESVGVKIFSSYAIS